MADVFNQFVQVGYEFEKLFSSTFNHVCSTILGTTDSSVSARGGRTHPIMERTFFVHQCGSAYIVKLAGFSGAMAVALAAYGAHFGFYFYKVMGKGRDFFWHYLCKGRLWFGL